MEKQFEEIKRQLNAKGYDIEKYQNGIIMVKEKNSVRRTFHPSLQGVVNCYLKKG